LINNNVRTVITALLCLAVGIGTTVYLARHLNQEAEANWRRQANHDALLATDSFERWMSEVGLVLRAVSTIFSSRNPVDAKAFQDVVEETEYWTFGPAFDAIALAARVPRSNRFDYEASVGTVIKVAGAPNNRAPDTYESFVVGLSSSEGGWLAKNGDLTTHGALQPVVATAFRVPNTVIMGPTFKEGDKPLLVAAGIKVNDGDTEGVLVGITDVMALIEDLETNVLQPGMRLRLAERDTEARAKALVTSIYGPLERPPDAVETITVRLTEGQARWEIYWDILPDYRGGPETRPARVILVAGVTITILVTMLITFLLSQNAVIQRRIQARTEEIRLAKDEAEAANRSKSEFLANMSHELRTPLNAIIRFAQMMADEIYGTMNNPKYVEYAKDIHVSARHLLAVIGDILDLSKIEALHGAVDVDDVEIDITDVLQDSIIIVETRVKKKGQEIELAIPSDLPVLYADARLVRQVVINMLSNANKYSPDGGRVLVRAGVDEFERIVISIEDNGKGIAPEDVPRVLEPFGQVRHSSHLSHEGTGIGLSLSKRLMELHGGTLSIDSEVGRGTTVTLVFPRERTGVGKATA